MQKEQSSYSGIVLNIALFGPFTPLSMDKTFLLIIVVCQSST